MIQDLVVSIIGSLIVSIIIGFCGNKAIGKHSSIILQVYVLFLAASTFVVSAILSVGLNKDIAERIQNISEANLLRFYTNCNRAFVLILLIIAGVSVLVILAEADDRSERRNNKALIDSYKAMK